jgi:hypothetical protein
MNLLDTFIKYYLEVAMGAVLPSLYLLFKKYKIQKLDSDAIRDGVRDLLRDRITALWRACKHEGISLEERDSLESMYKRYHQLGGNGNIDDLYVKIKNLPIVD